MLNIGETIQEGFFGICIALDGVIYNLINSAYKIFMALAGARILNSTLFTEIANRIYIIVGVVMLFVLSYALLRGIINPEGGKSGASAPNIIKSIVIAVLGLALTPVIFNLLYQAQEVFVSNDVLGRIIFRNINDTADFGSQPLKISAEDEEGSDVLLNINQSNQVKYNQQIKNLGGAMASTQIWKAFFRPADPDVSPVDVHAIDADRLVNPGDKLSWMLVVGAVFGVAVAAVATVATAGGATPLLVGSAAILTGVTAAGATGATIDNINNAYDCLTDEDITLEFAYQQTGAGITGSFDYYSMFIRNFLGIDKNGDELKTKEGEPSQKVTYLWGISGIVGIFALYCFVSFSIDMAVRAAKLAYYQVIAPVPLILQVLPSFKANFTKYLKSVMSTFAEVFIRISVVYIIVYLISHIGDVGQMSFVEKAGLNGIESALAIAILVIGLITFAKQAPKIICDTFGIQSGSLSFGITKKLADGGALTAGAAIGAGITGGVRNAAHAFANKEKWRNANGKFTPGSIAKNVGRGLASTAAGTVSGLARGGYGARKAQNFGDVRKAATEASNTVTDRRDKREQFAKEHGNTIRGVALGHLQNVGTALQDWAVGSVDTSYYDGRMKLDQDIDKFKTDLESSVSKDRYVMDQQNRISSLERMNATDYAYSNEVLKRVAARMGFRKKAANESYEDYRKDFERNVNIHSAACRDAYHDITDNINDPKYISRANFVLDPTSQEYRDAENQLNDARHAASDEMKAIKADAVQRALVQAAATGQGNDTSRMYDKFFEEHMEEFKKYGNVKFGDGSGTLEQYIMSQFGKSAMEGTVDMNMVMNGSTDYKFDVTITDPVTKTSRKENVYYDSSTKTFMDSTGHVFDMKQSGLKVDLVTSGSGGISGTYDGTTRVKSNVSDFKDQAGLDSSAVLQDTNYRNARKRRRRQDNNGNK